MNWMIPTNMEIYNAQSQLCRGVYPKFKRMQDGGFWCKLTLPTSKFDVMWACCPGDTRASAMQSAITQAKRHMWSEITDHQGLEVMP